MILTNSDRIRAYKLRLSGYTWQQIGQLLGYDGSYIERDLRRSMTRSGVNLGLIRSPALAHRIALDNNGSVSDFLRGIRYPLNAGRRELSGKDPCSARLRTLVRDAVGIDPTDTSEEVTPRE